MMNLRMTSKVLVIVLLDKFTDFHVILLRGLLFSQSITASNAALPATSPVFLEARDDPFSAGLRSFLHAPLLLLAHNPTQARSTSLSAVREFHQLTTIPSITYI